MLLAVPPDANGELRWLRWLKVIPQPLLPPALFVVITHGIRQALRPTAAIAHFSRASVGPGIAISRGNASLVFNYSGFKRPMQMFVSLHASSLFIIGLFDQLIGLRNFS